MSDGLRVFISHCHEEKLLAKAWQELINTLTMGTALPWYSSDERAAGGVTPGEWRKEIQDEIESANTILVLVTPTSNEKPWVFFESGLASGQGKDIVPVYYFMKPELLNSVFKSMQCYDGDAGGGSTGVMALCGKLMLKHLGTDPPEASKVAWESWIQQYLGRVREEREQSLARTLFHDHFHDARAAQGLEGDWFAKWTQQYDDGHEDVFEVDTLFVWTTESRLRVVGLSTKEGREKLTPKGLAATRFYPMEGVVSRRGWVALSYWSGGNTPICGTALLTPQGSSGELFEGTWQGYTARDINAMPEFTRGRVVLARQQEAADGYWPELRARAARDTPARDQ